MVDFLREHVTLPTETDVNFLVDGVLVDPEAVVFTVFDLVSSPPDEITVGIPNIPADRISTGHYYARFEVPRLAAFGAYKVLFNYAIRDNLGNLQSYALELPFNVISQVTQPTLPQALTLINELRILLRDNNPDAYYRFAPPLKTGEIKGFTRKTGYIWQDDELEVFISLAADFLRGTSFGSVVPKYPNITGMFKPPILIVAAAFATYAEAIRWTSEEFTYDINGVSLTIDRSSKFQSLSNGYLEAAKGHLEIMNKSIRFTKGVKMTTSISRGALLGPAVAHAPLMNFIQTRYKL